MISNAYRTYRSIDLVRLLPVTLRQLQWWDEHKVLAPKLEGHVRVYTYSEALAVGVIAELRNKGLSLQQMRAIVRRLDKTLDAAPAYLVIGVRADQSGYYTSIQSVDVLYERSQVIELFNKMACAAYLVDVAAINRRLQSAKGMAA